MCPWECKSCLNSKFHTLCHQSVNKIKYTLPKSWNSDFLRGFLVFCNCMMLQVRIAKDVGLEVVEGGLGSYYSKILELVSHKGFQINILSAVLSFSKADRKLTFFVV